MAFKAEEEEIPKCGNGERALKPDRLVCFRTSVCSVPLEESTTLEERELYKRGDPSVQKLCLKPVSRRLTQS